MKNIGHDRGNTNYAYVWLVSQGPPISIRLADHVKSRWKLEPKEVGYSIVRSIGQNVA